MKNLVLGVTIGIIVTILLWLLFVEDTTQIIIETIDPYALCVSLFNENRNILYYYGTHVRMENWSESDRNKFWESAIKFNELECASDILTDEELKQLLIEVKEKEEWLGSAD